MYSFLIFVSFTAWIVSTCGVISGPYFPVFGLNTGKYGPEITPYFDTFDAVQSDYTSNLNVYGKWSFDLNLLPFKLNLSLKVFLINMILAIKSYFNNRKLLLKKVRDGREETRQYY